MTLYSQSELEQMNQELESEMMEAGAVRYLEQIKNSQQGKKGGKVAMESQTTYGHSLLREVVDPMARGLRNFLAQAKGKPGRTPEAVHKLASMDARTTSYIAAKTILDTLTTGEKFTVVCMKIAQKITDEEYLDMLRSHNKVWYDKLEDSMNKAGTVDYHHKINVFRNMGNKAGIPKTDFGYRCMAKMGDVLVHMFRLHTGLIELHKEWEYVGNRRISVTYVYPTPKASIFIEDHIKDMQDLNPDCGPTCIRPRLWSTPFDGGYHNTALRKCNPMVHTKSARQLQEIHKRGKFSYREFNAVIQSGWRINTPLLDILLEEAKQGANWSTLPSSEVFTGIACPVQPPKRERGPKSKAIFKRWFNNLPCQQQDLYKEWREVSRRKYREDRQRFSRRRQLGTVLRIAQRYRHFPEIFFNCFLDSRGRDYTIGTLSPQGVDYSKALIQPADAEPLGEYGYKWLGLQITGVYGYDKNTLEERKLWILNHHEMLLKVANDPLGEGYEFWTKGVDKPHQFLAACLEYKSIQDQLSMGIPVEACVSRLVAAQDGSCNGIQHFSAMLKDEIGGAEVNLRAGQLAPKDIYGKVAKHTLEFLSLVKPEHYDMARILIDIGISRKTTKRQTMIVPYGGTIQGCKEYSIEWVRDTYKNIGSDPSRIGLIKRIKALNPKSLDRGIDAIGKYLGTVVWKALGKVVVGAVAAMKFIKKLTRCVALGEDDNGRAIEWSTPNGFYVVQDYKDNRPLEVDSRLCGRISMYLQIPTEKVKNSKMMSSVSPNFVHSMDAAHMFKTIGLALDKGIKFFAVIHDSYGTHLGRSEELALCIRQAFYEMYAIGNPLRRFYREVLRQWMQMENPKVEKFPTWEEIESKFGSLDLNEVFEADFFFI